MQQITLTGEAYNEVAVLQAEEAEHGAHLCEDKLRVLYEWNIEAEGTLGEMLAEYDPFGGGSGKSHSTSLEGRILTVQYHDDEGLEHFDEYEIIVG